MIVAARKGGPRPKKPPATHAENPSSGGLFSDDLNEWVGWHEAVEDLIPDLPETKLADWQKERLPDELTETTIVDTQPNARGDCRQQQQQPTKTVAADPAGGAPRAVLVDGKPANFDGEIQAVEEAPMVTVSANTPKHPPRAVLVNTNWSGENRSKVCRRKETDPAFAGTVSDGGRLRAVLVNTTSNMQVADAEHPAYGQVARERSFQQRAVMGRRVVQMTPRALARFQTFPDEYELPDSKSLACRIIGNAVPPLLMQKCISHWRM